MLTDTGLDELKPSSINRNAKHKNKIARDAKYQWDEGNLTAWHAGADDANDVPVANCVSLTGRVLLWSCPEDWMCVPSSSAVQRVSTLRGLQEFTVVEGCECRERPPICTRESSSLLLHPGTPYEMRLDVGVCSGHCQLGGCRPLRNKTVTVPGPNGAECHSVIEQCACAGSCYRTSYMETVYDYVDTDEPLVKEIDVGRCVGSCSGADTRKCVFRDKKNPGKCMAGLYGKQTSCTPSQFKVHRYSDKEKRTKEAISITACKCL
uniref:Uncharacterized protein n=1 Tax=Timema tahoe TaxID=61484 RepID=A0A7R9IN04_9NEOP|nr:unnamed protein product [Timema tahoe]